MQTKVQQDHIDKLLDDEPVYLVIDNTKSNIIEECFVGVMNLDNVIDYLKETLGEDEFEDKYSDIEDGLQILDYNVPLFIEVPDCDDLIEVIKIKKYF